MGGSFAAGIVRAAPAMCLVAVLAGAVAPGAAAVGLAPRVVITPAVTFATSDTTGPDRPAVGFDGTDYLVITCRTLGSPTGLVGVTVSAAGAIRTTFQIVSLQCPVQQVAVAFDGTNYLVAFAQEGSVRGVRVSPDGTVLDGSGGFTIAGASGSETHSSPALAFGRDTYLVVWSRYRHPEGSDIRAARVSPDGAVLGAFSVSTTAGNPNAASVAFDGADYLVVWRTSGAPAGVAGARVTPAGLGERETRD